MVLNDHYSRLPSETIIRSLKLHQQLYGEKGMTINLHVDLKKMMEALGFKKNIFFDPNGRTTKTCIYIRTPLTEQIWNVADRMKNVLADVSFEKIAESGAGGTEKFAERNSLVKILGEANKGGWLISLNMINTMPKNELIIICTWEMIRKIELSPPEITAEKFNMNNPGIKYFFLQNNSKSLNGKIADTQTGTEINSEKIDVTP